MTRSLKGRRERSQRVTSGFVEFGQPIWKHQSIGNYIADMAKELEAARKFVMHAARQYDIGRADKEAGMAKLFASKAR